MAREMKDSGIEWIGEIPTYWDVMPNKRIMYKVKDICDQYSNESILSLTKQGVIVRDLVNPKGKMPTTFDGYQRLNSGNLLLCLFDIDVTPRCIGLVEHDGLTSPAYSQFVLRDDNKPEYYNYLLRAIDDDKCYLHLSKNLRSTLTETDFGFIKNIKPPINEQNVISEYLDKKTCEIDLIIEKTKQSIEEYKKYKQSLIEEVVTKGLEKNVKMKDSGLEWIGQIPEHWECKKIKYAVSISRGLFNHRPRNDKRYYDGDYPFIQTGDVARATKYITTYSQSLNELGKSVSKEFPKGTLVMTIAANIGDIAVLNFDSYFPDSVIGCIPKENYNWNYLYYLLIGMKEVFIRASISNAQANLNIERVKELFSPLSNDINEQIKIANYLDCKCEKIESLIKNKNILLNELEAYKKSLIYEVVTGKKEV